MNQHTQAAGVPIFFSHNYCGRLVLSSHYGCSAQLYRPLSSSHHGLVLNCIMMQIAASLRLGPCRPCFYWLQVQEVYTSCEKKSGYPQKNLGLVFVSCVTKKLEHMLINAVRFLQNDFVSSSSFTPTPQILSTYHNAFLSTLPYAFSWSANVTYNFLIFNVYHLQVSVKRGRVLGKVNMQVKFPI